MMTTVVIFDFGQNKKHDFEQNVKHDLGQNKKHDFWQKAITWI